jgi:hypothetical protein
MNSNRSVDVEPPVIVVSGLARSGTSMMMRMLEAGGVAVLSDGIRRADLDNPHGYYEFEAVKGLEYDVSWVPRAKGKAVKVIHRLLQYLPSTIHYKVVFMRRQLDEVVASWNEMVRPSGQTVAAVARFTRQLRRELHDAEKWLSNQNNLDVLYVNYNLTLNDAEIAAVRIREFLALDLDVNRMQSVVEPLLYRQRAGARRSVQGR